MISVPELPQFPELRMATDCAAAIERPRLAARIYDAMKARVTVISAPAGFGKTTAVAGVFADMPGVRVRLDLNAQNDTLFRFVEALSRVLEPIAPGARLSFAGAFDRALQSAKTEQSLALWMNEHLKGVHATVFMDQLHYLRETERVARFLTALVETAGKHIRWVFVSREDFGLPIPRWMSEDIMELPVDAHDLKFEFHEVAVAAALQRVERSHRELKEVYNGTAGWPMGVMFALRSNNLISSPESYDVLSQRIFVDRTEREREFLLATCLLPSVNDSLCRAAGWHDASAIVAAMRNDAPFIFINTGKVLQYHDAFAAFLENILKRRGLVDLSAVLNIAAGALEEVGDVRGALLLYTRFPVSDELTRLLATHGIRLLEEGYAGVVQDALAHLDAKALETSGILLAIKAILETRAGRFDTFLAFFSRAMDQIQNPVVAAEITYLYACELIRQRHADDCIELLAPLKDRADLPLDLRASIHSAIAEAYGLQYDSKKAYAELEKAMQLAGQVERTDVLARIYSRAAFIALYTESHAQSREWALRAQHLAKECGQFNIAAAAGTILYACAFDFDDDPEQCLQYLAGVAEDGLKGANPYFELYGLINAYELQVERGDANAIEALSTALRSFDVDYGTPEALEALLPSDALRATWKGDFLHAYQLLAASASEQDAGDRRALRWAEIALYAVAAGLYEAAENARSAALEELIGAPASVRAFRARTLLALVWHRLGHEADARRTFETLETEIPSERCGALLRAVAGMSRGSYGAVDALETVSAGGLASMLRALPGTDAVIVREIVQLEFSKPVSLALDAPKLDEVDSAINAMLVQLDRENPLTAEHSRAVSRWCARIARKLGWSQSEITYASRSGLIHDVGKIKTPPEILNANRALDEREWKIMRSHAAGGAHMIKSLPVLHHLIPGVLSHHERPDGKGYPNGLKGGSIPYIARLVAVADCFNAMIGRRPYRKPMLPSDALEELHRMKGTQFDPELVEAMTAIVTQS